MTYLICYDIENNRVRTTLATKLQDWGMERIQKSVFIGELSQAHHARLTEWLMATHKKNKEGDETFSVLLINLSARQVERSIHYGSPEPDWAYVLGKMHTLIL